MVALAAPCGIVGATAALAAGATGFSNGVGFVVVPTETGDGPESLRAGANSAPSALLRFISLESPNLCSCAPPAPNASRGGGFEASAFNSAFGADFATTAIFAGFWGAATLFFVDAAELLSTTFALVDAAAAFFEAKVFLDVEGLLGVTVSRAAETAFDTDAVLAAACFFAAKSFFAAAALFAAASFFGAEPFLEVLARFGDLLAATDLGVEFRVRADFDVERFGPALSDAVDTFFLTSLRAAIGQVSRNARQNHPSAARGSLLSDSA